MILLSVKNLSISFKNEQVLPQVVHNISFDIVSGKTVALVGGSGSGKTLTALSILRLLPPHTCEVSGKIWFEGTNLQSLNNYDMCAIRGKKISMIFQEPMTALNPLHSIQKQIAETINIHTTLSTSQVQYRIDELLTLVELNQLKNRGKIFPHEISGGQRQRVMIAMALANRPKLLIADEPTTAVDVITQSSILKLLRTLQDEFKISILLITHDLNVVKNIAHDVCIMNQGKIIEKGSVSHVWCQPKHSYTKRLIAEKPIKLFTPTHVSTVPIVYAKNLSVTVQKKRFFSTKKIEPIKILNHFNFTVPIGQTLGIVGESGSGKTTLAYAILKLITYSGEIYFKEHALHTMTAKTFRPYRRSLQMVFQDPYGSLNPRFKVYDILREGLGVHEPHLSQNECEKRINKVIKDVNLDIQVLTKYPHQFSGGQRQRIALARVLILKPQFIILDEPTSALDHLIQTDMLNLLALLQKKYQLSYLLISHDLSVIQAMAHHVLVLKNGCVIECDTTENVIQRPRQHYTQQLIHASFSKEIP